MLQTTYQQLTTTECQEFGGNETFSEAQDRRVIQLAVQDVPRVLSPQSSICGKNEVPAFVVQRPQNLLKPKESGYVVQKKKYLQEKEMKSA